MVIVQWISVEDKLPRDGDKVLILIETDDSLSKVDYKIYCALVLEKEGKIVFKDNWGLSELFNREICFWCYIPEFREFPRETFKTMASEWIKVSDKMPQVGEQVLILAGSRSRSLEEYEWRNRYPEEYESRSRSPEEYEVFCAETVLKNNTVMFKDKWELTITCKLKIFFWCPIPSFPGGFEVVHRSFFNFDKD